MRAVRLRVAVSVACALTVGACAAKVPPPLPATLTFPELLYPTVPKNAPAADAASIDRGWRYLQNEDLSSAEREFQAPLKRNPRFHPALTGRAYVALARRDHQSALAAFDAAIENAIQYVPALLGRGQTLLALGRDADAIAAFEAALLVDPSLAAVRQRLDVLRFRGVRDVVERARTAAREGRLDDARSAYQQALQLSPDTAFLHRELGLVERRRGDLTAALAELRRAVALDTSDAATLIDIGDLLEQQGHYDEAVQAFRSAFELDPSEDLRKRVAFLSERAREAKLPAEFLALPQVQQITRGDLAALIGVRFEELLRAAPSRQVVTTDTSGHWANRWIAAVARVGVIEPFANHTFQPKTPIRRVDLATAVQRLLTLATGALPALRKEWTDNAPTIADVGQGHLNYAAVSIAVASGAMPLIDGRFQVSRNVSGAETIEVIDRVRAIAVSAR